MYTLYGSRTRHSVVRGSIFFHSFFFLPSLPLHRSTTAADYTRLFIKTRDECVNRVCSCVIYSFLRAVYSLMEFRYGHWLQCVRIPLHVYYIYKYIRVFVCACGCTRVFLKTSRIFGKTGNRHAFFRLPGRKRAANLTILSARRVFLEPTGYKSNGWNVSRTQRRLPPLLEQRRHAYYRVRCRLQPFNP